MSYIARSVLTASRRWRTRCGARGATRGLLSTRRPLCVLSIERASPGYQWPSTTRGTRFEATLEPAPATTLDAATGTDGTVSFVRVGRVTLPLPDTQVSLDVWRLTSYGGGLFVWIRR